MSKSPSLPPGNLGLPVIGETLSFLRDSNFSSRRLEKYGKVFKTSILGKKTVIMTGAKANQFLFKHENKYVQATWPKSTKILLGPSSLSVQSGEFHTSRRKLLYQAFQPRALESYLPKMEEITRQYFQKWTDLGEFTWYREIRDYTFDIASSLLVGTEGGSQTPLADLYTEWVKGLFSLPIPLPWTTFGKSLACRQKLLIYIEEIVKKRASQPNTGNDALGLLLAAKDEEGNNLSLAELKDQVLLLLFAGHETLTSALVSFCLLVAQHPEVWTRLRQEQRDLNLTSPLSPEKLKAMTYLEQVLKEVLRLIPPVGGGFRKVIESFEFDGYLIPKNWLVQYQIRQTQRDPEIYPESEVFNPDRFAPGQEKQESCSYVPFGGGLRECLGKEFARLEMRVFAALLIQKYQWELLPNQDLSMGIVPTPHPKDGLKVRFSLL
ncbi:cytochrome P450 [Gloeocapsa sp. PCC 73106]|uniref:cytochrome P450 n=1 Tax=Gloeocapsa sp. PCC 73106 TaxID=102232 RepID=UPI0002AC74EA|nr:cytochrome P450 [Gloeocapsa sp. PCC 73106]ELS00074.1 cytochrome P450 [Gloeocapsa sp. PCC 73106]